MTKGWLFDPDYEVVYVIHAPEVRRVKIGVTGRDPSKRLKQLQTGSPTILTLVKVLEGGWRRETELHRRFADRRSHGEWYDDSVLDDIDD